ncbi:hypothetical protein [Peptoniphilus harei]|uniref:hypothetical protein n=1 Tax=Peptoniphilus harei TaxID=54005 RepID=UPI001F2AC382|nr:hypothetical protein [Peptoniphilus harei]
MGNRHGCSRIHLKGCCDFHGSKENRATGYGIFECSFGIFWFLGSWVLGVIYSKSLPLMIGLSIFAQVLAIPFYLKASREI